MKSVVIVSDIFSNIKELKEAIFHDMISKHYETSIVESGPTKYIVKYFDNTCKWRLHA
uniref:Transposase MuDR plant domain-containing protein n=2 Tax=Physcomitrium patens TaxID=3218 RepID=A0A7I3ZY27_PHYPA